jgi:heme exporter protein D
MSWGSASAFFAMGGKGWYVWGAYGVTALAVVIELAGLRARARRARRRAIDAALAPAQPRRGRDADVNMTRPGSQEPH